MPEPGIGSDCNGGGDAADGTSNVQLLADACLSVQRPGRPCNACASACPVDAIGIGDRFIQVSAKDCIGCGRCQLACPTEAIRVAGFDLPRSNDIRLECSRVPTSERAAADVVVPCLGGISSGILRNRLSRLGQRITIMDRGWCESCTAGGTATPWAAAVERIESDLEGIDQATQRVLVVREPLDRRLAGPAPAPPGEAQSSGLSRRQLFGRLTKPWPQKPTAVQAGQSGVPPARVHVGALDERLAWLRDLGDRMELPASLFPSATIADTCCDNQVCVRSCPTGALHSIVQPEQAGVAFEAAHCIACGACERGCPTQSIAISAEGAGVYTGPVMLRVSRRATCRRCDADFVPAAEERECLACRKDADVARLGHALFRRKSAAVDDEAVM